MAYYSLSISLLVQGIPVRYLVEKIRDTWVLYPATPMLEAPTLFVRQQEGGWCILGAQNPEMEKQVIDGLSRLQKLTVSMN